MNALILGGENPRHREWVRQVAKVLEPHFENVVYQDYRHWQSGGPTDIEYEAAQAVKLAKDLGEYIVVAKSIGSVLTCMDVRRGQLHPRRCLLMGLPLGAFERFPEAAEGLATLPPTIVLQNEHDPLGSAQDAAEYLNAHPPQLFAVRPLPGDTHDYVDFGLIEHIAADPA